MKIAIAGYGVEGKASYDYWSGKGHEIVIVSEKANAASLSAGMESLFGENVFSELDDFDLIIRSPGINPRKLPYGGKVWSATNEFFEQCPAPIIAVTGTKGKGTTSSLIASILKAAGKNVHLVGNIGTPAIAELSNIGASDIVVYEISSFQLWDIKKSPHIAVVLGIEADHLDVHDSMDDYVAAKANIVRFQGLDDIVVFNANNKIASGIAALSSARKIEYPFDIGDVASNIQIPGPHNIENASAAVAAVSEYVSDSDVLKTGIASFTGLPHRIKLIRELNGIKFYDDSYSSAPAASIAALKSFTEPKIIILGGYDKGADFGELARFMVSDESLKKALLIGQTKYSIAEVLKSNGVSETKYDIVESTDFASIVSYAHELAVSGDVVLLSPGSASFDMFKNFTDRGEQFVNLVESL